jgi:hypothetical protein
VPFLCATGLPADPLGAKKNRWTCGFTCETTGCVTEVGQSVDRTFQNVIPTVKIQVESLKGDIDTEGAVLEFATPIPWYDLTVLQLLHQDHWVQDPWHGRACDERRPDDRVRTSEVV